VTGSALSAREFDLLSRVANGESYRELARDWGVEEITVRTTGARVLRKLGANNITHAVLLACRAGLLDGRPQRHGDHAGYVAHQRRGETPCEACAAGELEYQAERARIKRQQRADARLAASQSTPVARDVRGGDRPSGGRTQPREEAAA
jgi:DNA-binding CsgD family transcriptional regulator